MLLPVLVYAYDTDLGYSPDVAGWISSSALAGLAAATLIVSLRTTRWPMGRVSVVGMAIMLVFTSLTLFLHQSYFYFILTLIAGFGGGLTQAAVAIAMARTVHYERAFSIFTAIQFFYPGFGAYFFPRLIKGPGIGVVHGFNAMQLGQLLLIFLALLAAPVVSVFRLREKTLEECQESNSGPLELSLILRGPAALSIVGIMIYGASNGAVWAYAEGIGRVSGLDVYSIGDIITYANIIAGIAALGVAWLGNRIGHYIPLIGGILAQLLSMYILVALPDYTGYFIGIVIFTVAWAIVFPYFFSIQTDLDSSGTVVAFGQFTNLVGTALGPSLSAVFVGAQGDFVGAIWVSAIITVLALLPMIMIPILKRKNLRKTKAKY